LQLLAPAKINIGLRVIQKRSDKYHDIETVFYPIHLADQLEVLKSDKLEFYSNVHLERDANLCLRALHFFCERTGINAEVKMILEKKIPIGSGLGGGSSDAAAVLLALQELYGKPLSEIELYEIASQLGSDVPFFIKKIPSYATGKGEILQPIKYKIDRYILTVVPGVSVPTSMAYSIVVPTGATPKALHDLLNELGMNYSSYKNVIVNDFEPAIFKKFPVISEIKSELYHQGAEFALMSGSGSSLFGFFQNELAARQALDTLTAKFALQASDITPP
jgi:4-diphosphocytidyl-2-C-methyl-D-erythritol kinase